MKKIIASSLLFAALTTSLSAFDTKKADDLNKFFSHMTQKACADSTLFISAEETLKMIREGQNIVYLDVRTEGEHSIVAITEPNALFIPIETLFQAKNLQKLPQDAKIMIVCHSATRATMAAIGLKQIGIKNVQVVKGGIVGLSEATSVKNAPMK